MEGCGLSRSDVQTYSPGVLVGNWHEDMTLREDQLKLYRSQKHAHATATTAASNSGTYTDRLQEATEMAAAAGDEVCIGRPYCIVNAQTHAALAVNEALSRGSQNSGTASTVPLTAIAGAGPQVRTTWTVQRCPDEHNLSYNRNKPNVLHYGQRVRLANENANPAGFLYVQSGLQAGLRSSEIQPAVAAFHACADNVFVVARLGVRRQDVHDGMPVRVGEDVVLLHSLTNLPLACNGSRVNTSFGKEYAVTCGYITDYNTRSRAAVVVRPENVFRFTAGGVEGDSEEEQRDAETASQEATRNAGGNADRNSSSGNAKTQSLYKKTGDMTETLSMTVGNGASELLERIRAGALEMGGRIGFRTLSIALGVACNEQRRRRLLDRNAVRSGIARIGVRLTPIELDVLVKRFDTTGNNLVCAQDFLAELRGTMPQDRLRAVLYAFQQLTVEGRGSVEFPEMHRLFCANAGSLPDVADGLLSREEAVRDFESCWPGRVTCKIGTVTLDEVVEYYADVSPAVASTERFEATVRASWAIPATSAYLTSGPHRTINVLHSDDTYETVPIPDSLALDTRDPATVRHLLIQHGLQNVKSFTVSDAPTR